MKVRVSKLSDSDDVFSCRVSDSIDKHNSDEQTEALMDIPPEFLFENFPHKKSGPMELSIQKIMLPLIRSEEWIGLQDKVPRRPSHLSEIVIFDNERDVQCKTSVGDITIKHVPIELFDSGTALKHTLRVNSIHCLILEQSIVERALLKNYTFRPVFGVYEPWRCVISTLGSFAGIPKSDIAYKAVWERYFTEAEELGLRIERIGISGSLLRSYHPELEESLLKYLLSV